MKYTWLFLINFISISCLKAQDITIERPFPITLQTNQIVILDSLVNVDKQKLSKNRMDTLHMMYLSPKGDVLVAYNYSDNKPVEQELYEYDAKHNIVHSMYRRTNCDQPFLALNFDTLQTCYEKKFEYSNRNRITKGQYLLNQSVIEETEYLYDKSNRLIQSINKHIDSTTKHHFVQSLDSSTYTYTNDSILTSVWYDGKPSSFLRVEERENNLIKFSFEIINKKKDNEVIRLYNSNDLLIDEKFNNSLPLYSGKLLLRTNHIQYEYDTLNRISRKVFLVNDKPYRVERYMYK